MLKETLKIGIIGLGIGEQHANIYSESQHCNLEMLCDLDLEKLNLVGRKFAHSKLTQNADDVLTNNEIDLVSIASYDTDHHRQIVEAIKHKKHIFVEKPLCLSDQEFEDICISLERNPEIKLSSNFVLRSFPQFKDLKEKILNGELGTIYHIEGDYNYGRKHKIIQGWRGSIPFYSVTHGGGIHLIDLMKWITNDTIEEVVANGNQISTMGSQFKFPDLVSALLNFKTGMTGKVTSNYGSVTPHHHALRVYGTKGTFFHSATHSSYCFSFDGESSAFKHDGQPIKPSRQDKAEILNSFIEHFYTNKPPIVSKLEVLQTMATSLAIERSILSKKWEKVHSPFKA